MCTGDLTLFSSHVSPCTLPAPAGALDVTDELLEFRKILARQYLRKHELYINRFNNFRV